MVDEIALGAGQGQLLEQEAAVYSRACWSVTLARMHRVKAAAAIEATMCLLGEGAEGEISLLRELPHDSLAHRLTARHQILIPL